MRNGDSTQSGFLGDRQQFVRDVIVNVLANLIAAAIIYLFGVLVGLFPGQVTPTVVASLVLIGSVAAMVGIGLVAPRWAGHPAHPLVYTFTLGAAIACAWAAIYIEGLHVVLRITAGLFAVLLALLFAIQVALLIYGRKLDRQWAAERRDRPTDD